MKIAFSIILVFFVNFCFSQTTIDSGLVAFYPFCENAIDFSGNNNDGIIYGGVTFTEDRFGNLNSACEFDGIDGFIQVDNSNSLQYIENELTLSFWFRTKSYDNSWAVWLTKSDISPAESSQYSVYYNNSNSSPILFKRLLVANQPLELNIWYHLTITYSNLTAKCYLNGLLIGSIISTNGITQNDLPLDIGRHVPGETEFHHGIMDDIRIYNRALSAEEINILSTTNFDCNITSTEFLLRSQKIKLYPNPVTNHFTIQSQSPIQNIQVLDAIGNQIFFQKEGSFQEIETDGWQCGIYFVLIQTEAGLVTKKVVKQ